MDNMCVCLSVSHLETSLSVSILKMDISAGTIYVYKDDIKSSMIPTQMSRQKPRILNH